MTGILIGLFSISWNRPTYDIGHHRQLYT